MNRTKLISAMAVGFYLAVSPLAAMAAPTLEGLTVGRMKVTLMPEYDTQQVLVILEGKFADKSKFPVEVRFTLPGQVTKLTDVCSLSPQGHHFCQLFDIKQEGAGKVVDIKLPFSDFFIDYQYAPFTVAEGAVRTFAHQVLPVYDTTTLEVHVQKPARAASFTITPGWEGTYQKDGFDYYKYIFENVKAGQPKEISVSYSKQDAAPSVEQKFSAMATPQMFSGMTGELLAAAGALGLLGVWALRRRARSVSK